MSDELKDSVEELYRVFAPYRRAPMDDYCPCCVTEQEYARLVKPELEDVGHEVLDFYTSKAVSTWGDVSGFKRFLPRIFEVLAFERHDKCWAPGMWLPITKLGYADWEEWPRLEREAVERYLHLLWLDVLDAEPAEPDSARAEDADAIFDGLATVYSDVRPFLDVWTDKVTENLGAAVRLAQFLRRSDGFFRKGKALGLGDWTAEAQEQVRVWLREPLLVETLESWFVDCEDELTCWSLAEAIELLSDYQGECP